MLSRQREQVKSTIAVAQNVVCQRYKVRFEDYFRNPRVR